MVLATPIFSTNIFYDNPNPHRYNEMKMQGSALKGVQVANI